MNLRNIAFLLFLSYLLVCFSQVSYAQKYYFKHLTADDGLSSNIVQNINKDTRGYLWISCNNALNRYDGSKFTKYIHNPNDSNSITSGGVNCTFQDKVGRLWISTKNGVCIFNYKTEKFTKIFDVKGENAFSKTFYLTKNNELFLITTIGVYLFNQKSNKFEKYFQSSVDRDASAMIEDRFGNLYIGTWGNGIIVVKKNRKDYIIKKISATTDIKEANSIESMAIDQKGMLWIGTRNGFYFGNTEKDISESNFEINLVLDKNKNPIQISNSLIHSLIIDENDKIWIGTENGLNLYDPESHKLQIQFSTKKSQNGLSNNLINCLYVEPHNGIWIGTYQGGVNFYSKGNIPFKDEIPYITQSENKQIQYVKSVSQNPDGKLWVGTDYGLLCFSKEFQLEKTFKNSGQHGSLAKGGVTAIYTDKFNVFWVGTWGGGVNRLDKNTGKFRNYSKLDGENTIDSSYTGDCNIISFAEDHRGYLWIANKFKIIDRYDRKNNSFKHIDIAQQVGRPNMEIKSVVKDIDDNLWIGATGAGLIKLDTKTLKTELFAPFLNKNLDPEKSLLSDDVYSVHIQKSGKIWLGTGKGLSRFDPEKKVFTNYSSERGLNSETVLGVISDNNDNLWLSTLKGISKFDTITGYFLNYNVDDGVISNAEVAYKSPTGRLFFAGVNGITSFYPDSIWKNKQVPPVVFTDFKLFDKSILFNSKILPYQINEMEEIVLKNSQNSFTIDFTALNFIQQNKNVYRCILEGFDTEWNYLGAKNETKYTNINPGTYYFKVKAANNSGVWNETERVLKIVILTPWWKTFLFRFSAVILIVLLTGLIIRLRTIQLQHQKKELIIKVSERTREIEKQQIDLRKQSEELIQTNSFLILNQKEIERQKNKLEEKNKILEQQKEQIFVQKIQAENMAKQLHEVDLKKIRFMTNVSHEFRTPLTLIYSPLENALREFATIDKKSLHSGLKMMYRNTKRLLRLINEFLDFSKIDAGLLKMILGKGNIHDFMLEIIESYRYLSEQNNIHFSFQSEMDNVTCLFDADKIEKIVNNLLLNAFKYTPSNGKIDLKLKVTQKNVDNEPDWFEIRVEDSGVGIKEEFKGKIYERFFQIDDHEEQTSGTGIGLALTNELITLYGGSITLESEPGKGSTFTVNLPCSARHFKPYEINNELILSHTKSDEFDYSNELESEEASDIEQEILNDSKSTVLLVEDSRDIVKFLQRQFSGDFNFVFAMDGLEGFEKAVSIIPQVIILDIMMPKMNGYQLCEKLKKDQRTCHIPVIFLTALAEKAEQLKGLEYSADDYITKPFDVELLKAKVLNLIETRNKLKVLFQTRLSIDSFTLMPDSADEKLMRKIMAIIEKEISNPNFSVKELSINVGLSRTHLYRKICEIAHQTPVEFIRNLRLEKSAKLLLQNKYYVSEVAYMAGFTEISYFRKIFKDFYGQSPSDYAKGMAASENIESKDIS